MAGERRGGRGIAGFGAACVACGAKARDGAYLLGLWDGPLCATCVTTDVPRVGASAATTCGGCRAPLAAGAGRAFGPVVLCEGCATLLAHEGRRLLDRPVPSYRDELVATVSSWLGRAGLWIGAFLVVRFALMGAAPVADVLPGVVVGLLFATLGTWRDRAGRIARAKRRPHR